MFLSTVLDCDTEVNETKEQINELIQSYGIFKFVGIMREKFQEATTCVMLFRLRHMQLVW